MKEIEKSAQIPGRVTAEKLRDWIQEEFYRLEISGIIIDKVVRTRYSGEQMQNGAASLVVFFHQKEYPDNPGHFLCFYSLSEYHDHLKLGYNMYIKDTSRGSCRIINNFTVDLRKP